MKIIIPMAGMGKRMRPHTLTTPKPLIKVAGKPIVQRLVEDIVAVCDEPVDEIGFVTGRFGDATEQELLAIAEGLGAKGHIFYQDEPLGTAHAILCGKNLLQGKVIVAFADTLFKANFNFNPSSDGVLWVQKIDDPSAFGVVKLNADGVITDYVEKPKDFVSDLAMIGIYYFKSGETLHQELQYLIDNNVIKGGEYQLPDALRNMTEKGMQFTPGTVEEWLDCGNKNATVFTNQRVLEIKKSTEQLVHNSAKLSNTVVIEPCYIGENAELSNCVIGPHVSVGPNTRLSNSVITNSIIQEQTSVQNAVITNSMIGAFAQVKGKALDVSISDYSTFE